MFYACMFYACMCMFYACMFYACMCMFYACCATTSAGLQANPGMPKQVLQHAGKASEYKKDSLNLFLPPAHDVPCGEHR